jgi:cysteine-rich repeat protein
MIARHVFGTVRFPLSPARRCAAVLAVGCCLVAFVRPAAAADVLGTIRLTGTIMFATPIPGIASEDLTVSVSPATEATSSGETCAVLSTTSDNPDAGGLYPDAGEVAVDLQIGRGGPHGPTGDCVLTLEAYGTDGVAVSARGSQRVSVSAAEIAASATVAVPEVTLRQSKAIAGVPKPCLTWAKARLVARQKCNIRLLKEGVAGAAACTDAGLEPEGCDPGDYAEALLALSFGLADQQPAPETAVGVDLSVLSAQVKCQQYIGKAAVKYAVKRVKLVRKRCVGPVADSESCREEQTREAARKLDLVDKCAVGQAVDGATGLPVPDVGAPCDACIDGAGAIDRRCLKGCLEAVAAELSDGIVGDVPECGNGVLQPGEFCDDGNLTDGDCCSSTCTAELGCP